MLDIVFINILYINILIHCISIKKKKKKAKITVAIAQCIHNQKKQGKEKNHILSIIQTQLP